MNELKVFQNSEFGELNIMVIEGKEYFPASQCARLLGYSNSTKAIKDHCKPEGVTKRYTLTSGGQQEITYISEGNLYRLIIRSKLPAAERFEKWVFDEVLPSLRHNGGYINEYDTLIEKTANAVAAELISRMTPNGYLQLPIQVKNNKHGWKAHSIDNADEKVKDELHNMMAKNFSAAVIAEFLLLNGIRVSQSTICRYKRANMQKVLQ